MNLISVETCDNGSVLRDYECADGTWICVIERADGTARVTCENSVRLFGLTYDHFA